MWMVGAVVVVVFTSLRVYLGMHAIALPESFISFAWSSCAAFKATFANVKKVPSRVKYSWIWLLARSSTVWSSSALSLSLPNSHWLACHCKCMVNSLTFSYWLIGQNGRRSVTAVAVDANVFSSLDEFGKVGKAPVMEFVFSWLGGNLLKNMCPLVTAR